MGRPRIARCHLLLATAAAVGLAAGLLAACGSGRAGAPPASIAPPATAPPSTGTGTGTSTGTSRSETAPTGPALTESPGGPPLTWSACTGDAGPSGYQCASLAVPLDYASPEGPTIRIVLDRRRAPGSRIGSLLVNPGGPGASGVDALPTIYGQLTAAVRAHFDVVGFDPRGIGRSAPVRCGNSAALEAYFHLDPAPPDPAGFAALAQASQAFARACALDTGPVLGHVSTVEAARDMDRIRQALGDARLTYLGFSYGTFLGATYAELFPGQVRAMVLDGAVDPAQSALAGLGAQTTALDGALSRFLASCRPPGRCGWNAGADPTGAYRELLTAVRRRPLRAKNTSRTVGPSELLYGTAEALYQLDPTQLLGPALEGAGQGDGTALLALSDSYMDRLRSGQYLNLLEANAAVNCLDAPAPPTSTIEADAVAATATGSIFGAMDLDGLLLCAGWPVPATGQPHPIAAAGAPPIVVVGSTGDPITPFQWAKNLAGELQRGVLLTRVGAGHTGYGFSTCVRRLVQTYLVNLAPPAPGTRCPTDGS